MQSQASNDQVSPLIDQCKRHHLKVTPQRLSIYSELAKARNHPTADDLYRIITKKYPRISFDTVNRTLLTFSETGMIDIIESLGNQRRFDPNTNPHHHFQCAGCDSIFDLYCKGFDGLDLPGMYQNQFTVFKRRVVFNGLCRECKVK